MTDEKAPAKPITISLAWYIKEYKVVSVTNTTAFKPGEWKTPEEVERWCQRPGFTVIMADNSLLQEVTGALITNAVKAIPIPTLPTL